MKQTTTTVTETKTENPLTDFCTQLLTAFAKKHRTHFTTRQDYDRFDSLNFLQLSIAQREKMVAGVLDEMLSA